MFSREGSPVGPFSAFWCSAGPVGSRAVTNPRKRSGAPRTGAARTGAARGSGRQAKGPVATDGTKGRGWGNVARRGARTLSYPTEDRRPSVEEARRGRARPDRAAPEPWIDEGSVAVAPVGRRSGASAERGGGRDWRARLPPEVAQEVARGGGDALAQRNAKRLQDATRAYTDERYPEGLRLVGPLARRMVDVAAVRELHGLCLYRLGRWKAAISELTAAERLSGGVEHHPVVADCHRALGHHGEVARLWDELRQASASAAVVTEGRIVAAGSLADRGDLRAAIRLLEQGPVKVRKPRLHHLRLWYALAGLHERAGDIPRARQLFRQLYESAPDFGDVGERLRALS